MCLLLRATNDDCINVNHPLLIEKKLPEWLQCVVNYFYFTEMVQVGEETLRL